jgi:hypothetical protein
MNQQRLFELYEKSYFHEMEVREKITGRVQITFALVATGYTIISYMFRMLDYTSDKSAILFFIILMLVCVLLSIKCIVYLVCAFWGNEYFALPSACDTDDYRDKLIEYNKTLHEYNITHKDNIQELNDIDLKMMNFVYKHYKNCSSHNSATNDKRSRQLHLSFKWLLFSAVPLILASSIFVISDLDVSSPRKETPIINVTLSKSVDELKNALIVFSEQQKKLLKEVSMPDENNDLPPSPPETPEPRVLIEDSHPTPSAEDK